MATLSVKRGDDLTFRVTLKDSSGTPLDLTGYTLTLSFTINRITYQYTTAPELMITAGSGRIDVLIDKAVTSQWGTSGTWALKYSSPSGLDKTPVDGRINVR